MKLYQGQCVEECPAHYFMSYQVINQRETNFKCGPCHPTCDSCAGLTSQDCRTCDRSNPLHQDFFKGECLAECPEGSVNQGGVCFQLPNHCLELDSALTSCGKCKAPYFLASGQCVEECPQLFYPHQQECLRCQTTCEVCKGPSECSKCHPPHKLLNGQCISECPQGTYVGFDIEQQREVNLRCLPCDETCKTCSGPLDNLCASCNQDDPKHAISLMGKCVESCPAGFVERAKVCFFCGETCATCSNPLDLEKCDTCKPGYILEDNKCVKSCPQGTFPHKGTCEPCSSDCKRCSSAQMCEECTAPAKLFQQKCVASCPEHTFVNVTAIVNYHESDLKCLECDPTCKTCSGSDSDRCLSCDLNIFGHDTFLEGKCVQYCPIGWVQRANTCFKCGDSCQTCENPLNLNQCHTCKPGYVFYNSQCLETCPEGSYNYRGKCLPCGNDCKRCESQISCQECLAPSKLYAGFCISRCPDGTYVDFKIINHHFQDQKCLSCDETCLTCGGPDKNDCISCNLSDPLHDTSLEGKCVDSCPAGFVERSKVCFYCGQNCATCSNPLKPEECDTCKPGFLKYGKSCIQACPAGTFQKDNECFDCSADCKSCNSITECTQCQVPSKLYKGECIEDCPLKTYLNFTIVDHYESDLKCLDCHHTCRSCSGPDLNNCLSCNLKERSHDTMLEGKCVGHCPRGYVQRAHTCFPCDSTCQTCSDPDDRSVCDSCKFGYIMYNSKCIAGCPEGTYESGKECKPCAQNCVECISKNQCSQCQAPYSLFEAKCLHQCPTGYFTHATAIVNHRESDLRCKACDPSCHTCSGAEADRCSSCDHRSRHHSTFLDGKCVQSCPAQSYVLHPTAKICMHCGPGCKTCTDFLHPEICATCEQGYFQSGSQCVLICPAGTYKEGAICRDCEANCATCEDASKCTSCIEPFELLNSDCVLNCPIGTFESDNICESKACFISECPKSCASCSSIDHCETCAPSYFFLNNYCVDTCPNGTYQGNGECNGKNVINCLACSENCLTCSSESTCLSCDRSNPLYDTFFEGKCLDQCPDQPLVFQVGNHECKVCPQAITQINHKFVLQTIENCDIQIANQEALRSVAERVENYYKSFTDYFDLGTKSLWQTQATELIHSTRNLLVQASVSDATYQGNQVSLSRAPLLPHTHFDSFSIGGSVDIQINIPLSAIQSLPSAHLGTSCFVEGVYTDSSIDEFQIPLCDISIISNGQVQHIQNLDDQIQVKFLFHKLPQNKYLSCAYWDSNTQEFSTAGLRTQRTKNEVTCYTPHLSSFQIIPTDPVISNPATLSSVLVIGCTLGFCLLVVVISLLTDFACLKRKDLPYYPHLNTSKTKGCCFVFKHSLLYNFPLVSIFSFQEPSIRAYSRAFWFTNLLILMLNIIGILFSNEILECDPNTVNQLIISLSLGLCLVPGSFIINLLAIKVRKATSKDDTQIFLAASVVNSTAQTRFIRRKCGVIFLVIVTVCVYVLGVLNLYFLDLTDSFIVTFGIALAAGVVFSIAKITLASIVAHKYHQNPGFGYNLCVDVMTDMVTFRARQGNLEPSFTSSQQSRTSRTTFNN